jgi:CRISPR-associated endonuclease Csn1
VICLSNTNIEIKNYKQDINMKRLGLDLGSASIGWTLRNDDDALRSGVITFNTGMTKGQSGGYSSPTKDRREARSKRRLIQARKYRKWELLEVLLDAFVPLDKNELEIWSKYKKGQICKFPENTAFLKWLKCDFSYLNIETKYNNPYELRVNALDDKNKLHKHEFGRALYHLVQRRGYKDIGETDKETEKQIQRRGESGFQKALNENRTIAEALKKEFLDKGERARNQYPYRDEYKDELEQICEAQGYDVSKNDKGEYRDEFVQKTWKAIIWQRPLRTQKGNIGKCTLEPTKPRCSVSHPIFEIFRSWSFINTVKYYDDNNEKQFLSKEIRNHLFVFFLKKDKNFKFEEIRNFLDKQFKTKMKYNYPIDKEGKYDTSVAGMPVSKGLIDVFGSIITDNLDNLSSKIVNEKYSINDLWHILSDFDERTATSRNFLERFAIEKLGLQLINNGKGKETNYPEKFVKLKGNLTNSYADLSLKAMSKIIPFLEEGYLYNEAVVLAKIPELIGEKWVQQKDTIKNIIRESNEIYNWNKLIIGITNKRIDVCKGLPYNQTIAFKNYDYKLEDDDLNDIKNTCYRHFGEKSWALKSYEEKTEILNAVKEQYQAYFNDEKRSFRKIPLLTDIFKDKLKEKNIELNGELYHHSNRENKYGTSILTKVNGIEIEILPEARIDSIKNPMFNKSMSILRKLVNELIKTGTIDKETEIVVELARELNDNNKRSAIERYQNERKNNREKYRLFLQEFNQKENRNINVEEKLSVFELWTEQIFEEIEIIDDKGKNKKENKNSLILKEKNTVQRYELWMEQKGQCMYTGKMISITQLFSSEIDIMHTIARSLLPDNTMANKTVGFKTYNTDLQKQKLPTQCDNYSKDVADWGSAIAPRLTVWIVKRENYRKLYEDRCRTFGNEDETKKNKRIQDKHYFKMHYNYWNDKIERFTTEEIKDSWVRRQLTDTQMISKYAREFLKTYFNKVSVQKGSTTADFRKIYGFQEEDELKSRNRHTHHAIDAAVLTLIPTNSSFRDKILKEYYEALESFQGMSNRKPFENFNSQKIIQNIEKTTLIVNYENDKILKQSFKNVRKRGLLQHLKDSKGNFVLDKEGKKIPLKAKGDSVRSELYAQTYLGKIRDVERFDDEQPKREGEDWKYKTGKDEFIFVKRESIDKVKASDKLIAEIVDPIIKKLVKGQKKNTEIKDYQGKTIRHVRIKTSAGKEVKERISYRSKHDYKNKFYSEAGSLPYAILLQRTNNGKVEREMFPVASFELAKAYKKHGSFVIDEFVKIYDEENKTNYSSYPNKKLLKVGQKVLVLKSDTELEKQNDIDFQTNRLYRIEKFSEGSIWFIYHLEANPDNVEDQTKQIKDNYFRELEKQYNIQEIVEDITISDNKGRKEDFIKRKFSFNSINDFRASRLISHLGENEVKKILQKLRTDFAARPAKIGREGQPSLLKISKENWNFLFEGDDFEMSLLGHLKWCD